MELKTVDTKSKYKEFLSLGNGASSYYLLPPEWFSEESMDSLPIWSGEDLGYRELKDYYYVHRGVISRALALVDKDLQDYFDKWRLGINSLEDRPKCPICQKEASFIKFSQGYRITCLSSECISKFSSENMIKLRQDPDSVYNSEDYILNHSEGLSLAWEDPNSGYNTESYLSNLFKASSKFMKAAWRDPNSVYNSSDFRKGISIQISKRNEEWWRDPNSIFNSPEFRTKMSINASINMYNRWREPKDYFNSEERSLHYSKLLKDRWKDPDDFLNSEEHRRNLSISSSKTMKKMWSSPEDYPYFHEIMNIHNSNGGTWGYIWRNLERYKDMGLGFSLTSKGHYTSIKAGIQKFMSSWELHFMELLDVDIDVKSYKSQPFSIPYFRPDTNKFHRYIPDFLVEYTDGTKVLVEIKPECFLDAELNLLKFEAGRRYAYQNKWEFVILTEEDLFNETN